MYRSDTTSSLYSYVSVLQTINAKPHGHDLISYQYQPDTSLNQCQTNGHNLSFFVSMRTKLQSRSNQSRVSISNDVFEVYMLLVKVNRHNYNFLVVIYITIIKIIMLQIYSTIKIYVIIYQMIKLIMLCIHLKRSSNE